MTLILDSESDFVLYNSDLTTHNICVYSSCSGEKDQLAGIID